MYETIPERLREAGLAFHALEIRQTGETVLRCCPEGEGRFPVYSITKSLTAAAFALAWDDGLVSPEMPLSSCLEERIRAQMPSELREMPFSRFLTMTAGAYPFRPAGENWLEAIAALETDHTDRTFHYSNIPAYLVGAAVECAVGGNLMSCLERRLLAPLGIENPPFARSPEGHFYGATGMELSVRELASLGQLFLQNGQWNGTSLIRAETVRELLTPRVRTGSGDSYGYFFRIAEDHVSMVGKWGQRCIVYPARGLVIAYLSHQPERSQALYEMIREYFASDKQRQA